MRRWAALAIVLSLSGCAADGLWFASTQMEITDYKHKTIALLPVVATPGLSVDEDTERRLQTGLSDGLNSFWVGAGRPQAPSAEDLKRAGVIPQFPWTPERLSEAAKELSKLPGRNYAAAVGISITSLQSELRGRPATMGLLIVFADRDQPNKRRWAMAGQWRQRFNLSVPDVFNSDAVGLLQDMRYWAEDRFRLWTHDKYEPDQPFVEIAGAPELLKKHPSTRATTASFEITAVHDAGIRTVSVVNRQAEFRYNPDFSDRTIHDTRFPIYLKTPINIPLVQGQNDIVVHAETGDGVPIDRRLEILRTSRPALRIFSVGVSTYEAQSPAGGAMEAARGVARWSSAWSEGRDVGARLSALAKQHGRLTSLQVDTLLSDMQRATALDDQVIFYFAGRISIVRQPATQRYALFLELSDAPLSAPGLASINVEELNSILNRASEATVFDVCSDGDSVTGIREALTNDLSDHAVFRLSACADGVGALGSALKTWLRTQERSQLPPVDELPALLQRTVPGAVQGKLRARGPPP